MPDWAQRDNPGSIADVMNVLRATRDFLVASTGERVGAGEYIVDDETNAAIGRAKRVGWLVASTEYVPREVLRQLRRGPAPAPEPEVPVTPVWARLRRVGVPLPT